MHNLPIHTAITPENQKGSLLLCGLNHGYSKEDERLDEQGIERADTHKSFFSDKTVNDYPFRNIIVGWFDQWGYPLEGDAGNAGPFERSIVQTNWMQSCSNNLNGTNIRKACIDDSDSFLTTCEALKPRLIFFFSQELLWAFNSEELRSRVESCFGKVTSPPKCVQKDVYYEGKPRTRFKFWFEEFEAVNVVAMPHATAARGLALDYIAAFKLEMSSVIGNWWSQHKLEI